LVCKNFTTNQVIETALPNSTFMNKNYYMDSTKILIFNEM